MQQKINDLKNEVIQIEKDLSIKIYEICEGLDYKNSGRFSYNIDRLKLFVKELTEFEIINP
jgi:hypothetical protein